MAGTKGRSGRRMAAYEPSAEDPPPPLLPAGESIEENLAWIARQMDERGMDPRQAEAREKLVARMQNELKRRHSERELQQMRDYLDRIKREKEEMQRSSICPNCGTAKVLKT